MALRGLIALVLVLALLGLARALPAASSFETLRQGATDMCADGARRLLSSSPACPCPALPPLSLRCPFLPEILLISLRFPRALAGVAFHSTRLPRPGREFCR